ncbi:MAG: hypothetical protein ACFCD0_22900 [Gemmataceae bacterium]
MSSAAADHPLTEAARAMIRAAQQSRSVVEVFAASCPDIYSQIERTRVCEGLLKLWGRSRNIDANTNEVIVHPTILKAIGEIAGVSIRGNVIHAGLVHTYGYLFSLIETPYGFKRDRWTKPDVELGLGIEEPTLRDDPTDGTLLTNVTWLAGRIAFRGRTQELRLLQQHTECVSPVVRHFHFGGLEVIRLTDDVTSGTRLIRLHTDLVKYPQPPQEGDTHLLVYSIVGGMQSLTKLITVFPVSAVVVDELTSTDQLGERELRRLPYNAYVRGLHEGTFRVIRKLEPESPIDRATPG